MCNPNENLPAEPAQGASPLGIQTLIDIILKKLKSSSTKNPARPNSLLLQKTGRQKPARFGAFCSKKLRVTFQIRMQAFCARLGYSFLV